MFQKRENMQDKISAIVRVVQYMIANNIVIDSSKQVKELVFA